jgi:transposase InsO family protein
MNMHKNARLTPIGRELLVKRTQLQGWSMEDACAAAGVSVRTGYKWCARYREEGAAGLLDRSSRPRCCRRASDEATLTCIETLRRQRCTQRRIAEASGCSLATVSRHLNRIGLSRLAALEPAPPVVRYERNAPGELLHMDMKKLACIEGVGKRITGDPGKRNRGIGWEVVHLAIDDHSRIAVADLLPDETGASCAHALHQAVAEYAAMGIRIERVMTDNGPGYRSKCFAEACHSLQIRHLYTRPYRPQTNGKAERFVQTALREWGYAQPFHSSDHRRAALPHFLTYYNWFRPHSALQGKPPVTRVPSLNNLLKNNT